MSKPGNINKRPRKAAARTAFRRQRDGASVPKASTGIAGLDDLLAGGLPRGRTSLMAGGPGCGKTILCMEFLVRGARDHGEPGLFVAFEESEDDLLSNLSSFGWDLPGLIREKKLAIEHMAMPAGGTGQSGPFDLSALFLRLDNAIAETGATRVVLDTVENLLSALPDPDRLRAEFRRLMDWFKERGVTTVVTAEMLLDEDNRPVHGFREYVTDCVIRLESRTLSEITTRRIQVVKYRGSAHADNECPFAISDEGIFVFPLSSVQLDYNVGTRRISSGLPALDDMLDGGFFARSMILISGTAGTGKSTLAAALADRACRAGKRALYFSFEESPAQIKRNMASVGYDLARWEKQGKLRIKAARASRMGLESQLLDYMAQAADFRPDVIVFDPVSGLIGAGTPEAVKSTVIRLLDHFRKQNATVLMTDLLSSRATAENESAHISSIADTWILLGGQDQGGERARLLSVRKSRGMDHSRQVKEIVFGAKGLDLAPVLAAPEGLLAGNARLEYLDRTEAARIVRDDEILRLRRQRKQKAQAYKGRQAALEAEHENDLAELNAAIREAELVERQRETNRGKAVRRRGSVRSQGKRGETETQL